METVTDRRPPYVRDLDRRAREAEVELEAMHMGLLELRLYLLSPKFQSDACRTVNPSDVLLRLDETVGASLDARAAA